MKRNIAGKKMEEKGWWNHRVMRHTIEGLSGGTTMYLAIHEVHYRQRRNWKKPKLGWTIEPVAVVNDNLTEMRESLRWMMKATKKPILDFDDTSHDQKKSPKNPR